MYTQSAKVERCGRIIYSKNGKGYGVFQTGVADCSDVVSPLWRFAPFHDSGGGGGGRESFLRPPL